MMPPSALPRWLRLKPVAICCSSVGVGQQVAGELLDRELVERHVAVEGVDHPVAPPPHVALAVGLVAVGVGIAGRVEPAGRHPLAVARRSAAADRPPARRRPASRRPGRRRPPRASAAGRSGRASRGGSASCGRPRATARAPRLPAAPARTRRSDCEANAALRHRGSGGRLGGMNAQCFCHSAPSRSSGGSARSAPASASCPSRPAASARRRRRW